MLQVAVLFLFAAVQAPETMKQKTDRPAKDEAPSGGRVLARGDVDFWGTGRVRRVEQNPSEFPQETVWAEPVRMPDGRFALYVPPVRVLRFLDDPNPSTARDYMAWQRERISKLRRAMEELQAVAAEESSLPKAELQASSDKPNSASPGVEPGWIELLYFKQPSCPYCDVQDTILEALRKTHKGIVLREITQDKSPELWKKHSVTLTPTIVVTAGNSPVATFRGLASLEPLDESIRKVVSLAHP